MFSHFKVRKTVHGIVIYTQCCVCVCALLARKVDEGRHESSSSSKLLAGYTKLPDHVASTISMLCTGIGWYGFVVAVYDDAQRENTTMSTRNRHTCASTRRMPAPLHENR